MQMQTITTAEAKNNFSQTLKSVQAGEKFIISYGRKHKKVAMIVPYDKALETKKEPRKFGTYKGKVDVVFADDFAMTSEELLGWE